VKVKVAGNHTHDNATTTKSSQFQASRR